MPFLPALSCSSRPLYDSHLRVPPSPPPPFTSHAALLLPSDQENTRSGTSSRYRASTAFAAAYNKTVTELVYKSTLLIFGASIEQQPLVTAGTCFEATKNVIVRNERKTTEAEGPSLTRSLEEWALIFDFDGRFRHRARREGSREECPARRMTIGRERSCALIRSIIVYFTASTLLVSIYAAVPFAPYQSKDIARSRAPTLLDDREIGTLIPGIAAVIIHPRSY